MVVQAAGDTCSERSFKSLHSNYSYDPQFKPLPTERTQYVSPYYSDNPEDQKNGRAHYKQHRRPNNNKYASDGETYGGVSPHSNHKKDSSRPHRPRNHPARPANNYRSDSEMTDQSEVCTNQKKYDPIKNESWERETIATSNMSSSYESFPMRFAGDEDPCSTPDFRPGICCRFCSPLIISILTTGVLLTPIIFLVLPRFLWKTSDCDVLCQGQILSLSFKLIILLIACCAIFVRRSKMTFSRVQLSTVFMLLLSAVFLVCNWAFYVARIVFLRAFDYGQILEYVHTFVNCALFMHYMTVIILELTHLRAEYYLKVVRNTDGESKFYAIGQFSIQQAGAWVLEQYYKDFTVYNPYLHNVSVKPINKAVTNFKLYEIDNLSHPSSVDSRLETSKAMIAAAANKRDAAHNDRFHEEEEYDRKIKKRRARLMVAAEEAFTHIKRASDEDDGPLQPMDAHEAAHAIFPSMARALQKYLKATRQVHLYSTDMIHEHLSRCIALDFTPRAFLEKYLKMGPVITSEAEQKPVQSWELITESANNRPIRSGMIFQLRKDNLSLIVYVARIPHFCIREDYLDSTNNRYVLRLQSETSV